MNSTVLAENILEQIGGKQNVITLRHCATRLRFTIIDNSKMNLPALKMLAEVIAVIEYPGQLQVVIGNAVVEVFNALDVLKEAKPELITPLCAVNSVRSRKRMKLKSAVITTVMYGLLVSALFYGEAQLTFIIGCVVAFIGSLALTLHAGFDEPYKKKAHTVPTPGKNNELASKSTTPKRASIYAEQIAAPVSGALIPLGDIDDNVFSAGIVGPGFAILPEEGRVYSPVDGRIFNTFACGHAIGIRSRSAADILIHVGINTVQLEGRYFHMRVKEGDEVKRGELLLTFDLDAIKQAGYDTVTPVIVMNGGACQALKISDKKHSRFGEPVMALSM